MRKRTDVVLSIVGKVGEDFGAHFVEMSLPVW